MERICAWCGADLGGLAEPGSPRFRVSHGICPSCTREVEAQLPLPLAEYLASLEVPVLLVDVDRTVGAAGGEIAVRAPGEAVTLRVGEVFECTHARAADCGLSVHCSGCTIRHSVEHTWATGEPLERVPATVERVAEPSPEDVAMLITTERVGDRVLLRIELVD